MGVALWIVGGGAAFLLARFVPAGRLSGLSEGVTALLAAGAAGVAATALDFGGWNEPDSRAGLFAALCAAAAVAMTRLARLAGRGAATS